MSVSFCCCCLQSLFKIKVIKTLNHFLQLELHWKSLFLTLLNRPLRRSPKTVKNLRYWPLLAWWMWLLESLFLKTLHLQCEKLWWKSITLLSQSDRNVKFFLYNKTYDNENTFLLCEVTIKFVLMKRASPLLKYEITCWRPEMFQDTGWPVLTWLPELWLWKFQSYVLSDFVWLS